MDSMAVLLSLIAIVLVLFYKYLTRSFDYWKERGVIFLKPYPIVGSLWRITSRKEHMSVFFMRLARKFKGQKFIGYFQGVTPGLLVLDPELIKHIVVKDFSHFMDRGFQVDEKLNPLHAKNLLILRGQRWKDMRSKISPTFTSGKMKNMFPLLEECADNFEICLKENQGVDLQIKDFMARYTTDVIGSSVFGVKTNSIKDPNDYFRVMGRKLFEIRFSAAVVFFLPKLSKFLRFKLIPEDLSNYFRGIVKNIIDNRIKTGSTRNDFIQLLMHLKEEGDLPVDSNADPLDEHFKNANSKFKLDDDDVVAQALVFFLAGFETSSTTLTFASMELARSPTIQQNARDNIEQVLERHNGVLSYQALQEMTYLDWIMQETLRMYPPLSVLRRTCNKKYQIPDTDIIIDEGVNVSLPVQALQTDPEFFERPDEFIPERFEDEELLRKNQFAYMPFGEGPRQCIGLRFARMQTKLGLYAILRKFEILESLKTEYPPVWDNKHPVLLNSKTEIYVQFKAI